MYKMIDYAGTAIFDFPVTIRINKEFRILVMIKFCKIDVQSLSQFTVIIP